MPKIKHDPPEIVKIKFDPELCKSAGVTPKNIIKHEIIDFKSIIDSLIEKYRPNLKRFTRKNSVSTKNTTESMSLMNKKMNLKIKQINTLSQKVRINASPIELRMQKIRKINISPIPKTEYSYNSQPKVEKQNLINNRNKQNTYENSDENMISNNEITDKVEIEKIRSYKGKQMVDISIGSNFY